MTSRRRFLQQGSTIIIGSVLAKHLFAKPANDVIMTVNGPISPSQMKFTLQHEHVLADFIGAEKYSKDRYNADQVFETALPYLKDVKSRGCVTFIDCSPAYLGRDVKLFKRLADASGLQIITNTGYYGAVKERFYPKHVYSETAEQIAARWIDEFKNGIEGTDIKPGFIKTSVDGAPLTEAQRKVIDAAAIAHLATGLIIGVHTDTGDAANEQLEILKKRGVSPEARIWIHSQKEPDLKYHIETAKKGGWVAFDNVNPEAINDYVGYLKAMKKENLLHRVLVSQDSGWYNVGEPKGGKFRDYNCIFTHFIPALKENGFSQKEIDGLFITNPSIAYTIKVKKL